MAMFVLLIPGAVRADPESALLLYEGRPIVDIVFTGNNSTRDFVIAREIGITVGDAFSVERLVEGKQNLENLGIFGSITTAVTETPEGVAVEYEFREMPPFVPYVAFKYTEENGFSVGPAVSSVNLFGRAVAVSGRALFGGTTTFALRLRYPWIAGENRLGLDLTANHLIRDDELIGFKEESDEVTPWLQRNFGKNVRVRGMAGYFHMRADRDGVTLTPDRRDHFFRFGTAAVYDTRDSWREPRHGWENEIELVGTVGDGDFLTTTVDLRRFQRLTEKHTLFVGALTSLQTGVVGEDVPVYFEYRLGGANSVRGQSVDLGKTLHGKSQMITTLEYQITVLPLRPYNLYKWSAAVGLQFALFTDTGIAWSTSDEFSTARTKSGFGAGLRLLIPGSEVFRFDVGFNRQGDVRFHMGTWFKWTAQRFRLR